MLKKRGTIRSLLYSTLLISPVLLCALKDFQEVLSILKLHFESRTPGACLHCSRHSSFKYSSHYGSMQSWFDVQEIVLGWLQNCQYGINTWNVVIMETITAALDAYVGEAENSVISLLHKVGRIHFCFTSTCKSLVGWELINSGFCFLLLE